MFAHTMRACARRAVVFAAACLATLVLTPAPAQAAVNAATTVTFPTTMKVGDRGLSASIRLLNVNTPPDHAGTNVVCNAGQPSEICIGERGIALVPSCSQSAPGLVCAPPAAEPGVFRISATGLGRPGTSCAGMSFAIAVIDQASGAVAFTPLPAGSTVTLAGSGSSCEITFTFDVLKLPRADANPAQPGVQTTTTTEHTQSALLGSGAFRASARATNQTTVMPAPRTCAGEIATIVASAGQTVITGTPGPDVIVGGDAGETIEGLGGDDTICSGNGADSVRGGAGNDAIRGQGGADRLFGDSGDDLLVGGTGNDDLRGGSGDDRAGGGDGTDRVDGGSGDDLLDDQALGGKGRDRLFGGTGADRIRVRDRTTDRIDCGSDRDSVRMDTRDSQTHCESVRRS